VGQQVQAASLHPPCGQLIPPHWPHCDVEQVCKSLRAGDWSALTSAHKPYTVTSAFRTPVPIHAVICKVTQTQVRNVALSKHRPSTTMKRMPSRVQYVDVEATQTLVVIEVHQRHTCIATLATQRHQQHCSEGSEGLHCLQLCRREPSRSSMPAVPVLYSVSTCRCEMWAIDET